MASITEIASSSGQVAPSIQPSRNNQAMGHFRGGRGGSRDLTHTSTQSDGLRGNRRGARGARGNRGATNPSRNGQQHSSSAIQLTPPRPPPPGLGGGGSFGGRLTKDAVKTEGEGQTKAQDGTEDVEAEVCFICASPVVHNSLAPCNHRTCHICALRLRALYKTRACAHCRSEAKYVVFTDDTTKRFEDFIDADFEEEDEVLGIKYERKEIYDDTVLLLRYNCPDDDCDIACWGWPDLHRHVKSIHHKVMCDLCTRNKKVFTHEHDLFTIPELRKHEKFGDDNPGAVDQSGFKGHPECGFCRQRFYGDDELYTHCRDKHERCHICDRRTQRREQQYFLDYSSLEIHFRKDHFLCADQDCLDKKFVVFESEMDLKGHQLETHPEGLSKDARKDARRVDISAFDYRTPHQESRGRHEREGRGGGRGRDPNTEPLPQSTAQPLRRDELAYQRQMAIQSAQSISTRNFGGQLTSTDVYAARPNGRNQEPDTFTTPRSQTTTNAFVPAINNLHLDHTPNSSANPLASPTPAKAVTPQEQARRLRHNTVTERVTVMLNNDQTKLADFRNQVSSYRISAISASQLIDTFFSLFDVPNADLGKLVKELADIYEDDTKRYDLLKAWTEWRSINEDYPSLPGPSGILPGSSASGAGKGGYRVLKLKSSTAQSSRSEVSKSSSWGNAANANPFPAMPPASANRVGAGRVGATPWVAPSSARPSPASSRPSSRPPDGKTSAVASDAFPALPAAMKPNTTMLGLARGKAKWDDMRGNGTTSPWGNNTAANGNASASASVGGQDMDAEDDMTAKKKGNKSKKQTLYKFG